MTNSKCLTARAICLAAAMTLFATSAAWGLTLEGPPKVAFIYASTAKDGGWNEALEAGRKAVEEELKIPVSVSENIPEEATKLRAAIDLYVKRGFNIIVGTTYGYSAPMAEAAKAYPNVAFLSASGTENGPNLESFYARTYQGWYLAGIAAGQATKTKKIGILAGFPVGVVNWDINSFALGAHSVDPEIETVAVFTNSWWDPVKEGQIAQAILDQKADVLATNLSATSALDAAEKAGAPSIGFQLDMSHAAPTTIQTSIVFRWEKYLVPTIKEIIAGTWTPEEYGAFEGMDKGVVELAPFGPGVSDETKARIEAARREIIAGRLDPFQGPLKKQDGTVMVEAGSKLDDGALWSMNYFAEGIVGTMPATP
ncbi:BMP family ABC transporter substrate-binding protein [Rhizobium laguerreae]|uniref:BMP family ABC transporter substrate-binding protein n=1 Tax=Rhizobium laguerreae TaxID=1076926 RepID=A0A6N9ZIU9_9HYPH|nr:BMP family ABC transporter substrate-binding protein [Rhizobium laguerreae]NEH93424.1 BMP family ABC transporter substrate-binding protein [Rhizobium laguerreae]